MSDLKQRSGYWAVLFAVIAITAAGWGWHQHRRASDLDFTQHRMALLEAENARLQGALSEQEKAGARAYEAAERRPIEEAITRIRGLEFSHPVIYDSLSRAGIKKVIEQKLSELYSDEDFKNIARGLSAFGLLDPGYPLKQKYIDLLGEQIAAFYDQHQHKLFMFEDASLHNTQNRVVLAHELTHALQDQNFGLLKMPLEIKNDDDLALATSALIEGDATLAMSDFMMKNISMQSLTDSLSGMVSQSMDQIQKSPRYLREMLMFPYLHGQKFCMALKTRGGYAAVSEAFRNPPRSSSQILHPEKYLDEPREEPVRVELGDTTVNGKKPLDDNVLGEMGVRILLEQWGQAATAADSASGWRGDRYLVFGDGPDTELEWKTVWNSREDADKFLRALMDALETRYGFKESDWTATKAALDARSDVFYDIQTKNRVIHVTHGGGSRPDDGTVIILIDATTTVWKDSLLQKTGTNG